MCESEVSTAIEYDARDSGRLRSVEAGQPRPAPTNVSAVRVRVTTNRSVRLSSHPSPAQSSPKLGTNSWRLRVLTSSRHTCDIYCVHVVCGRDGSLGSVSRQCARCGMEPSGVSFSPNPFHHVWVVHLERRTLGADRGSVKLWRGGGQLVAHSRELPLPHGLSTVTTSPNL